MLFQRRSVPMEDYTVDSKQYIRARKVARRRGVGVHGRFGGVHISAFSRVILSPARSTVGGGGRFRGPHLRHGFGFGISILRLSGALPYHALMPRADALTSLKRLAEEPRFFRADRPVTFRTAHACLDVLGALNSESGGTLAQMPLPTHVAVAVQGLAEPVLRIRSNQIAPPRRRTRSRPSRRPPPLLPRSPPTPPGPQASALCGRSSAPPSPAPQFSSTVSSPRPPGNPVPPLSSPPRPSR